MSTTCRLRRRDCILAALLALTSVGALAPGSEGGAQQPFNLDDVMALRAVQDPQISPDGSRVAYVLSEPDFDADRYASDVWLVASDGGDPLQLTTAPGRDEAPRWSPDGRMIAFLSDREEGRQLWLIRPDGGEAARLSDIAGGVQMFAWSPDSTAIALTALEPEPREVVEARERRGGTILHDREFRRAQVFLLDLASRDARQLTTGDFTVTGLSWSPTGAEIAFSAQPTPRVPDIYLSDIYAVRIETASVRKLVEQPGIDWRPVWSPDGSTIAFSSEDGTDDWIANNYVCTVPAAGGETTNVGRAFDGLVTTFEWAPDSRSLFFSANRGVTRQLFRLAVDTGEVRQLSTGTRVFSSFSLSARGDRMALLAQDSTRPWEVHVSGVERFRPERITDTNPVLAERALGEVEVVDWRAPDGTEIEGLLMKPVAYREGTRYPLLTYVHGGPASLFTASFHPNMAGPQPVQGAPYPVQVFANRGYGVFFPNPRGSNGYGEAFRMAVVKEWGYADYEDIQSGIDHLIESGFADPDRLGIMGWSYGGFMTAWTITRTGRFKAASVGAGMTNIFSFYGQTDIPGYLERYLGDVPWQDIPEYQRHSTIFHVGTVTTPTLIQHGENDPRVPLPQAHELYQALKRRGIPVELAIYPGEGHMVARPRLQRDMQQRNLDWFERWMPAGRAPATEDRQSRPAAPRSTTDGGARVDRGPSSGESPPQALSDAELTALFEAGRQTFFDEVAERLEASEHRARLTAAETGELTGGRPDLYDRVVFIAWQKDAPAYERLIASGRLEELERRFRSLTLDTARRLVDNLFLPSSNFEQAMSMPGRSERRPLEHVLTSLGYRARSGAPDVVASDAADPSFERQWWIPVIRLPEAHRISRGDGVRVAVLDTGVDRTRSFLRGRLAEGLDLVGHRGVPWGRHRGDVWDWGSHGTVVSSVLVTTAPGVTIIPMRPSDGDTMNDPVYPYWVNEAMAAGIYAAVHAGAQVINVSAGTDPSASLEEAARYARQQNVVLVSAAGRYGRGAEPGDVFNPSYPAAYPDVISAGAFGVVDGLFTGWDRLHPSPTMDVLAPGVDVYASFPSYTGASPSAALTGTSLSTPVVAGVAALLIAARPINEEEAATPGAYVDLIEEALQRTANPRLVGETGFTALTGYGVIDAAAALDWILQR